MPEFDWYSYRVCPHRCFMGSKLRIPTTYGSRPTLCLKLIFTLETSSLDRLHNLHAKYLFIVNSSYTRSFVGLRPAETFESRSVCYSVVSAEHVYPLRFLAGG